MKFATRWLSALSILTPSKRACASSASKGSKFHGESNLQKTSRTHTTRTLGLAHQCQFSFELENHASKQKHKKEGPLTTCATREVYPEPGV
jgi:hypothetical protein